MLNPKVSIIVPVFNLEDYIEDCVKSLLKQTYSNIEIILVDDGSSDESLTIIKHLAKNDDRVIFTTQTNGGAAKARNTGLDIASGEYVTFVDGDDRLSSNTIEENIVYFADNTIDWVAFSVRKVDSEGYFISKGDIGFIVDSTECLSSRKFVPYFYEHKLSGVACGAIYKRSSISGIRFVDGLLYEDSMFFVDLVCNTNKGYLSTKGMYYYVDRPNSSNKQIWDFKHLESKYNIVRQRLLQYRKHYPIYESYYAQDESSNYYFFKREAAKSTEGAQYFYEKFKKQIRSRINVRPIEELKCLAYKCNIHKLLNQIK